MFDCRRPAAGQPQASRRCLTAAGQPQASRTSLLTLLTLFSRSTEIPGPSLLTLFARSTEIPVKAGASQLGKKHPARLLGHQHSVGLCNRHRQVHRQDSDCVNASPVLCLECVENSLPSHDGVTSCRDVSGRRHAELATLSRLERVQHAPDVGLLQDQWRGECHAQAVAVFGVLPAPRPNRREQPPARHCVVGRLPRFLADTLPEMWAASIAAVARWEHAEGQERVAHAAEAHAVEVRHRGEPSTMQSWLYRW